MKSASVFLVACAAISLTAFGGAMFVMAFLPIETGCSAPQASSVQLAGMP